MAEESKAKSAPQVSYPVKLISKLLMLTERRVQQLSKEGVLPKGERGRYELVASVQGYIKFLRDRAIGEDLPGDAVSSNRARILKARADIAELEAERLAGSLIPASEVQSTWVAAVSRFRQKALAIPVKAAPLVSVETEIDACHEIVETFVHEALAELAATVVQAAGASGGDGADAGGVSLGGAAAAPDSEPVGRPKAAAKP